MWLEPQESRLETDGLSTSSLRLRFSLLPHLLQDGEALVRCVAEIPEIYRQEVQDVLSTRPPYHASVLGDAAVPGMSMQRPEFHVNVFL